MLAIPAETMRLVVLTVKTLCKEDGERTPTKRQIAIVVDAVRVVGEINTLVKEANHAMPAVSPVDGSDKS